MKSTLLLVLLLIGLSVPASEATFKRLKKYYDDIEPFFDFFTKHSKHHHHKKSHHHDKYVHHKEIIKEVPVFIPVGHLYHHGGPHHEFHGGFEGYGHGYPGPYGGAHHGYGGYVLGHGGEHGGLYGGHEGYGGFHGGHGGGLHGGHGEAHDFF